MTALKKFNIYYALINMRKSICLYSMRSLICVPAQNLFYCKLTREIVYCIGHYITLARTEMKSHRYTSMGFNTFKKISQNTKSL